jgi:hypothetical protein
VIWVLVLLASAITGGVLGRLKGSSFFIWFMVCAVAPGFGQLAAVFSRDERTELYRHCPRCHKVVALHDALCTRCGAELEFPGTSATA